MGWERSLELLIRRHPISFAILCGAAGFGLATWGNPTPRQMFTFYLMGWGAFAFAVLMTQASYLARTCYRDWRAAWSVDDPMLAVEKPSDGVPFVRDLRETLHGGEIVLAMLGAIALGAIASAFAFGFFFTALIGADTLSKQSSTWSTVITWAAGIMAALFSLSVLILDPLGGLRYWFASRRLIESEQLSALKILAAAVTELGSERVLSGDQTSEASNLRSDM